MLLAFDKNYNVLYGDIIVGRIIHILETGMWIAYARCFDQWIERRAKNQTDLLDEMRKAVDARKPTTGEMSWEIH